MSTRKEKLNTTFLNTPVPGARGERPVWCGSDEVSQVLAL